MSAEPAVDQPLDPAAEPDAVDALLRHGELDVVGRLVEASNATLFCSVTGAGLTATCVYKPIRGERPLWDFPDGTLAGREVAAFAVSAATGWDLVPRTVLRDGPFGPGACQLWVQTDPAVDLQRLVRSDHPDLRRLAVLDAVINNADRKGGHLLPVDSGRVFGCDHGVCFHVEDKLRTLLWRWRGEPFTDDEIAVLERLRDGLDGPLRAALTPLLSTDELLALAWRLEGLLAARTFPEPSDDWPAIPWPPF